MINKVREWYFDQIPNSNKGLQGFLANSFELAGGKIDRFIAGKGVFPVPGKEGSAYIPSWVLGTETLDDHTPLKTKRALQTAFWNWSILMNAELTNDLQKYKTQRVVEYNTPLLDNMTYMGFTQMLNSNDHLRNGPYQPFIDTTNDFLFGGVSDDIKLAVVSYLNYKNRDKVVQVVGPKITDILDKIVNYSGTTTKGLARLCKLLYEAVAEEEENQQSQNGDDLDNDQEGDKSDSNQENNNDQQDDNDEKNEQQSDSDQENDEQQGDNDDESGKENEQQDSDSQDSANDQQEQDSADSEKTPSAGDDLTDLKQAVSNLMQNSVSQMQQALEKDKQDKAQAAEEHYAEDAAWGAGTGSFGVVKYDVFYKGRGETHIQETETLAGLGRYLSLLKVTKEREIDPEIYGNFVLDSELYRVPMDMKIFGSYDDEQDEVKKEWRIVVDLSGSMNTSVDRSKRYSDETNRLLWHYATRNAKGAFLALRNSREDVTVYGHCHIRNNQLIQIASHYDTSIDDRFDAVSKWPGGGTGDDDIIQYVAKHEFNKPDSMKIILMLSDGKPGRGIPVMKRVVDRLRRKGYVIISFSLVREVLEDNDQIYGEEWNMDASQGNLDTKFKELFIKMAKEYK